MSSQPTPEKVANLRSLVIENRSLESDIAKRMKELQAAEIRLSNLKDRYNIVRDEIKKLLEGMDCKFGGNTGTDQRVIWMLSELVTNERPQNS